MGHGPTRPDDEMAREEFVRWMTEAGATGAQVRRAERFLDDLGTVFVSVARNPGGRSLRVTVLDPRSVDVVTAPPPARGSAAPEA
jgi:hypothetical protein